MSATMENISQDSLLIFYLLWHGLVPTQKNANFFIHHMGQRKR